MRTTKKQRKCKCCGREIEGKHHLGLCESCFNKFGSPLAVILAALGAETIREIIKNTIKK